MFCSHTKLFAHTHFRAPRPLDKPFLKNLLFQLMNISFVTFKDRYFFNVITRVFEERPELYIGLRFYSYLVCFNHKSQVRYSACVKCTCMRKMAAANTPVETLMADFLKLSSLSVIFGWLERWKHIQAHHTLFTANQPQKISGVFRTGRSRTLREISNVVITSVLFPSWAVITCSCAYKSVNTWTMSGMFVL